MKSLKRHIAESKALHQNVNIQENFKFKINRDTNIDTHYPETWDELRQIIEERRTEVGFGLRDKPINFNDIDITGVDRLVNDDHIGVFSNTGFEYIDVSEWDVSHITDMTNLFSGCKYLRSTGNLSKWNVSNVISFKHMFNECYELQKIGNISKWNVSQAEDMGGMFMECMSLRSIGDLSKWDVSNVESMEWMFFNCVSLKSVGDLSKWDNIENIYRMFTGSAITNIPDWYKG